MFSCNRLLGCVSALNLQVSLCLDRKNTSFDLVAASSNPAHTSAPVPQPAGSLLFEVLSLSHLAFKILG